METLILLVFVLHTVDIFTDLSRTRPLYSTAPDIFLPTIQLREHGDGTPKGLVLSTISN